MTSTLLRNGRVFTGTADAHTAIAFDDDRVVFVGHDDQAAAYDGADRVIDLHGRLVAPAFTDAHVHTVQLGFQYTELDLSSASSLAETLDLVAVQAVGADRGDVLIGQGWEDTAWPEGRGPTGDELERAAPGFQTFLGRIEGHSAVISPALAARVPGLSSRPGWHESGRVEREAKIAVSQVLSELIGPDQRRAAARAAVALMARHGIAGFHENGALHIGPAYELDIVRQAAAEVGLLPTLYWGERDAFDQVAELGVAGLAGDLNVDGAIGSHTAALHTPYDDDPGSCGHPILDADQIAEHLVRCTQAGIQGGFHCIGEAALETLAAGIRQAARRVGTDAMRAARHRVEHLEMPSPDLLEVIAECGIAASVQPVFDAQWGGPGGLYDDRLGGRWQTMNPFASMQAAGIRLAFGSDAPVTPIGPWEAIRAAVNHRSDGESLTPLQAFTAHTSGGWFAANLDDRGLELGAAATYAVWDAPDGLDELQLPILTPDTVTPRLTALSVAGNVVLEEDAT